MKYTSGSITLALLSESDVMFDDSWCYIITGALLSKSDVMFDDSWCNILIWALGNGSMTEIMY